MACVYFETYIVRTWNFKRREAQLSKAHLKAHRCWQTTRVLVLMFLDVFSGPFSFWEILGLVSSRDFFPLFLLNFVSNVIIFLDFKNLWFESSVVGKKGILLLGASLVRIFLKASEDGQP